MMNGIYDIFFPSSKELYGLSQTTSILSYDHKLTDIFLKISRYMRKAQVHIGKLLKLYFSLLNRIYCGITKKYAHFGLLNGI